MRVVSLVPSVTETLLAWGITPVACTDYCEQPLLHHIGGTKNPRVEDIVALAPDVVVVCDEENRREDADALVAAGTHIHNCSPRTIDDVTPALRALADAVAATPDDGQWGSPLLEVAPLGLRAFVPIWRRPWMTIGTDTYGASLLAVIGVEVIDVPAADSDAPSVRYPTVDLDAVIAAGPDVVLAPSEPYAFKPEHLVELSVVAPVLEIDGQDLFWWGVRTPAAVQRLHDAIGRAR
ncbi:MAG: helical backbone metal receptor [Aquihabitans sp.]